ncbi:hypothetical protein [Circoviridae sp.]|nr:hypothetical protein [Circoviridae sp.]UOF82664.1 hypothetical protein [Circoviridae sp.]
MGAFGSIATTGISAGVRLTVSQAARLSVPLIANAAKPAAVAASSYPAEIATVLGIAVAPAAVSQGIKFIRDINGRQPTGVPEQLHVELPHKIRDPESYTKTETKNKKKRKRKPHPVAGYTNPHFRFDTFSGRRWQRKYYAGPAELPVPV